ncbi:uncharacterized protein LOC117169031 [Belonocnema kinseyi]|uniref:uncharacterized protein LOC117169031 n=1 Tax=Belonocnema kinseyi TaxID=2817044 RepID=UPI00143DD4A2|nr:uncharacterized protein LOC117169031 [Belonocnema kinseyi]
MLSRSLNHVRHIRLKNGFKKFMTSVLARAEVKKQESVRMKEFHEKLRADRLPRVEHSMRFVDLVLVETDPKSGEIIPNKEKQPTKWGDWQQGGRVTDF